MKEIFRKFAERVAYTVGTPWAFIAALGIIATWGVCGPIFQFSEQWQLIINSFTTIVTFLMVFIIQNTQNRDFQSLHVKLDALLYASDAPRGLIGIHDFSDDDLERLDKVFRRLRGKSTVAEVVKSLE